MAMTPLWFWDEDLILVAAIRNAELFCRTFQKPAESITKVPDLSRDTRWRIKG